MKALVDHSFRLLAARYMRKQARQLGDQFAGVRRGEDPEFVHRARVASRRLRAALRLFRDCFKPSRWKEWRREVRCLTRSLGEARDKDVQIAFLCQTLAGLGDKDACPGVARVLVRLERRREKLQTEVVAAVDRFESSGVLEEMLATVKRMLRGVRQQNVTVTSDVVLLRAEEQVLAYLEELLSFRECVSDPLAEKQHHAMRIAAKRLRYTLEICEPAYGDRLTPLIGSVKELQTLLGEIHDCDVWVTDLEALLARESKRIERYYGHTGPIARLKVGFDYLRDERRGERAELFSRLRQRWGQLEETKFWDCLVAAVRWRPPTVAGREPSDNGSDGPEAAAKAPADAAARPRPGQPAPHLAGVGKRSLSELKQPVE